MSPDHHTADAPGRNDALRSRGSAPAELALTLSDYPELKPVLSSALAAVITSLYPEKVDAKFKAYLERVTVAATLAIYAPIAATSAQLARGAQDSRAARVRAVAQAAAEMAARVTETAVALQTRTEGLVTARPMPGDGATDGATGVALDDAENALERVRAAAVVTQAATAAASQISAAADDQAAAIELQVLEAAALVQTAALATCYQFAMNVAGSAAEAVLSDGMPDERRY